MAWLVGLEVCDLGYPKSQTTPQARTMLANGGPILLLLLLLLLIIIMMII